MKRIIWISSFALFALLAMYGCDHDSLEDNSTTQDKITLHLTSKKPAISGNTRTYYDEEVESIRWNDTGEQMKIAFSTDNEFREGRSFYVSEATVSSDGSAATFDYTFSGKESPSGNLRFHGIYPASATPWSVVRGNMTPGEVLVNIPQVQQPTAESYDPKADVMLSISQQSYTSLTEGMVVPMIFARMVTHGKITLTNIQSPASGTKSPTSEAISRVDALSPPTILQAKISAPGGKTMTGVYYIDVLSKGFSEYDTKSNSNYVMLDFTNSGIGIKNTAPAFSTGVIPSEGSLTLWLCTQPFELSNGEVLDIDLYTANGKYHRSITASESGIAFKQNKLSTLTVSMASATYTENILEYDNTFSLPGGSGKTMFEIRTNLDCEAFHFDLQGASEWLSVQEDYSYNDSQTPDNDGCVTLRYYFIHKENPNASPRSQEAVLRAVMTAANSNVFNPYPLTITQEANRCDVNLGFYVGEFVEMAGLRWYPVNCGFDETHLHGLLYQWGRKYGQGYKDETISEVPSPLFEERTVTPDPAHSTEEDYPDPAPLIDPDDNTVYSYKNFKWSGNTYSYTYYSRWYSYNVNLPDGWIYVSEKVDNPCPEGWHVPTKAEWDALENCYLGVYMETGTYFGLNCAVFKEEGKLLYLPISGYRNPYQKQYLNRNTNAYYWSSTKTTNKENEYYALNYTASPEALTTDNSFYQSASLSVRCVQPISGD